MAADFKRLGLQDPATQIQQAAAEEIRNRRQQEAADRSSRQAAAVADGRPSAAPFANSSRSQGQGGVTGRQPAPQAIPEAGAGRLLSSDTARTCQEADEVGAEVIADKSSDGQAGSRSRAAVRHEKEDETRTEIREDQTVERKQAGHGLQSGVSQETHSEDMGDHVDSTTTKVQRVQHGDTVDEVTTRVTVAKWKSDMMNSD